MSFMIGSPPLWGGKKPIAFVSSSINQVASSATNTVTAPAGIVAGDLLVMVASNFEARTISTPPSGWTMVLNESSDPSAQVYTKIATGSEPADYAWGWSGSNNNTIAILCYRSASAHDVLGARTLATSTTSTGAGITPTKLGALIGVFVTKATTPTVSTPPSGMTQRALQTSASPYFAVYDLIPSPASATGDKTLVWSASGKNNGWLLQIY
jgi:hypothetical protein